MTIRQTIIAGITFIVPLTLGVTLGHFHGKTQIYERIMADQIECHLTVNPLTAKQLK